ncbi:hypothetical protein ACJ73_04228 [Blastomyces percursus]|uniref:Uncharacterized protein n=1 Tax=Blastomyces percursus TaxID=1658174 RepID=A0A1J9QVZ7_9EURO|nr:hypothetical protein ACJ73_04228 [Blastomyces percursus]
MEHVLQDFYRSPSPEHTLGLALFSPYGSRYRQAVWPGAQLPEMIQGSAADRQQELDMDFELAVRNLFGFLREWEDEVLAAQHNPQGCPPYVKNRACLETPNAVDVEIPWRGDFAKP